MKLPALFAAPVALVVVGCTPESDYPAGPADDAAAPTAPVAALPDPVAGTWAFSTADFTPNAQYATWIRGVMTVTGPGPAYRCSFTAHQVHACRSSSYGCQAPRNSSAEQVCALSVDGSRVVIQSQITRASSTYVADDFVLAIDSAGSRMSGQLTSSFNAEATFERLTRN